VAAACWCATLRVSTDLEASAMTIESLSEKERSRIEAARQREEDQLRMLKLASQLRSFAGAR
jgi:hypothetical protein